jgi:hypothetical protein
MTIREAPFALRVVRRRSGDAGIVYRRRLTKKGEERLDRIGSISPLAFSAGAALLRAGTRKISGTSTVLSYGPYHPLDADWGARIACYSLVAAGLCNPERLHEAATNLQHADGTEASWWLGLMQRRNGSRAVRALRILIEAVR